MPVGPVRPKLLMDRLFCDYSLGGLGQHSADHPSDRLFVLWPLVSLLDVQIPSISVRY